MADYNIEEIAARYKSENGRMYGGAYEWMIAEIQRLTVRQNRTVDSSSSKVLRDKTNSKAAKTAAGSALSQPYRKGK